MLSAMAYAEPSYDNDIVDLAGDALIGDLEADRRLQIDGYDYLEIVNNWRSAHAFPLNTFQMTMRNRGKQVSTSRLVAQRTKRLSSIEYKLGHLNWLKLSEMQDVAGCRVIVNTVKQVDDLVAGYKRHYSDHKLDDKKDYIRNPKKSGYRSSHLIYRYSNPRHGQYEDLKIEMQFRSTLQHCWAAALETVDILLGESLKSNRGSPEWKRFFALMSSHLASLEGFRRVPKTPKDNRTLLSELRELARKLNVESRLKVLGKTLNVIGASETRRDGIKYILLVLEPSDPDRELTLYGFREGQVDLASELYSEYEQRQGPDAVLVSVSEVASLQRAYPNYFLDTTVFLRELRAAIS